MSLRFNPLLVALTNAEPLTGVQIQVKWKFRPQLASSIHDSGIKVRRGARQAGKQRSVSMDRRIIFARFIKIIPGRNVPFILITDVGTNSVSYRICD